jgi:rhamnosyltransferase
MSSKTAAIIVTYQPNQRRLLTLVNQCAKDLDWVLIVDNGSRENVLSWLETHTQKVETILAKENLGIAKAQNIGISRARELGADQVILFDQDSDLASGTLSTLIAAVEDLQKEGHKVACVGPRYLDKRQNNAIPFFRIEGLRLVREVCREAAHYVPVDHLIASGSVIPIGTLDSVGGMQEDLFIDYVDLEWCERAKSKGFQSYGICAAQMEHALGDEPIAFMGVYYPSRSPLRHYYMCRNAIWMYRSNHVRWNWKIVDGFRLLRKIVFYSIFAKPRHHHAWMMSKGVVHGLAGKMGRYSH